uniref:Uncharacterized protein n=1 Tax=Arundo donax TaxID=35708 RepID=A0A0A8ZYZ7_ARUDO
MIICSSRNLFLSMLPQLVLFIEKKSVWPMRNQNCLKRFSLFGCY